MSEREEVIRKIAKVRFLARKEWLNKHPDATSTVYGHAHGKMGQIEAGVVQGRGGEEELEKGRRLLIKKYGVDVGKLPE